MEGLVEKIERGIELRKGLMLKGFPKRGRFAQELNLDLYLTDGTRKEFLLHAKLFKGRAYYRNWIELFGLRKEVLGEPFFSSELEAFILDLFSPHTGRIFVEYFEDLETAEELKKGVPPALSRLGFELARRGFTYVRDLMEGGHKLQGEKSNSREVQLKRYERLREEVKLFAENCQEPHLKSSALGRFKILESLWKQEFL